VTPLGPPVFYPEIPPLGLRRPPPCFACGLTVEAICPRCHQYFDAPELPLEQCPDCDLADADNNSLL